MKQEDKDYEKWLYEVKNRQPVLDDPDRSADLILKRVSRIRIEKRRRKMLVGAWISGVAAILLLGLFINETLISSSSFQVKEGRPCEYGKNNSCSSLPGNWEEMRPLEKGAFLSFHYARLRQIRQDRIVEILKQTR